MEPMVQVAGARGFVNTLQFSRDGSVLLATSLDQTVSVYDVASGTRLGDPIPVNAPFSYPAFLRPDGGAVAATLATGIAIWDLDPEHMVTAACQLAGRNVTATEWATYLSGLGEHRATCPEFA
jgi:DNA-binding beta-propeller fold protein YncE